MNIENKVFGKLFQEEKVELESQKVELALADDVKVAAKDLADHESKVKAAKIKAMEAVGNYLQWANGGISKANSLGRLVDQLIAKSKELGVDAPQNIVDLKKESASKAKLYSSVSTAATSASKTILG